MGKSIARCGYRCDLCPAYTDNISNEEDRAKVSDGWFRCYGFRIPPEAIYCDGCLSEDFDNPHRIDPDCEVRQCAEKRGLPNCAHCDEYICDKLTKKIVFPDKTVRQAGAPFPQEDYVRFIEPYSNRKVLDEIREDVVRRELTPMQGCSSWLYGELSVIFVNRSLRALCGLYSESD